MMQKFRKGDRVRIIRGSKFDIGRLGTYVELESNGRHSVEMDRYGLWTITPDGIELVSEAPKVYSVGSDSAMHLGMEN